MEEFIVSAKPKSGSKKPCLVFPVGDEFFAVPLADAYMVIESPVVTAIPTSPRVFLGLINFRGELVPLLDTTTFLGRPNDFPSNWALIFRTTRGMIGLALTDLPLIYKFSEAVEDSEIQGGKGVFCTEDKRLVTLLDVGQLFTPERIVGVGRLFSQESS
jgi:purine-binding chemotaxis protein CheW